MEQSQLLSKFPKEKERIGNTYNGPSYIDDGRGPLIDLKTTINTFYIEKHLEEPESPIISPSKEPRRPRKASFGDALHDLRSFPQRTMRSIIGLCDKESSSAVDTERDDPDQPPSPNWLRRAASTSFGRSRRPSVLKTLTTHSSTSQSPVNSISPSTRIEPLFIPCTVAGGTAARAAAAAQNEKTEAKRTSVSRQDSKSTKPKVPNDSESGVGIEVRDQFDYMDYTLAIVRQGWYPIAIVESYPIFY